MLTDNQVVGAGGPGRGEAIANVSGDSHRHRLEPPRTRPAAWRSGQGFGGGILNLAGSLTVSRSTFNGNQAIGGSGMARAAALIPRTG